MKQYKDCAEPSIIQGWNHTQIIICNADHHLKEGRGGGNGKKIKWGG